MIINISFCTILLFVGLQGPTDTSCLTIVEEQEDIVFEPQPNQELKNLIKMYFPREQWETATCVMWHESRYKNSVRGDNGQSIGLFQIKWDNLAGRNVLPGLEKYRGFKKHEAMQILTTIKGNIRIAFKIWESNGWLPNWLAQKRRCDLDSTVNRN